jgi:hypothetical protein
MEAKRMRKHDILTEHGSCGYSVVVILDLATDKSNEMSKEARIGIAIGILGVVIAFVALFRDVLDFTIPQSPRSAVSSAPPSNVVPADPQATLTSVSSNIPSPTTEPPTPTFTTVPTTPTPPPSPTLMATPTRKVGDVLYEADWSSGMDGWVGSPDWDHISNMIVSDGSQRELAHGWIKAPYVPDTSNYAVEVTVQLVNTDCQGWCEFGIIARAEEAGAIAAGFGTVFGPSAAIIEASNCFCFYEAKHKQQYKPDGEPHTYKLEVKDTSMKLYIDKGLVVETSDNRYLKSGRVGLFSVDTQMKVLSFRVIKL